MQSDSKPVRAARLSFHNVVIERDGGFIVYALRLPFALESEFSVDLNCKQAIRAYEREGRLPSLPHFEQIEDCRLTLRNLEKLNRVRKHGLSVLSRRVDE